MCLKKASPHNLTSLKRKKKERGLIQSGSQTPFSVSTSFPWHSFLPLTLASSSPRSFPPHPYSPPVPHSRLPPAAPPLFRGFCCALRLLSSPCFLGLFSVMFSGGACAFRAAQFSWRIKKVGECGCQSRPTPSLLFLQGSSRKQKEKQNSNRGNE